MEKYSSYLIKIFTVCLIPYFAMFIAYCISCLLNLSLSFSAMLIYGFGIFLSFIIMFGIIVSLLCDYYFYEWNNWLSFVIEEKPAR